MALPENVSSLVERRYSPTREFVCFAPRFYLVYQVRTISWPNRRSGVVLMYRTEWHVRTCEKKTEHTLYRGVREKGFLHVVAKLQAKSQKREKSPCLTVLQFRWVISTWWDENMTLFVLSCYEIHWNWFCGRKQIKNAKIRRGAFFSRRVLW